MPNLVVITARMDSTRLPGKALIDLGGCANLGRVVARLTRCKKVSQIIVATSTEVDDQPLADYCTENRIACHRGDKQDVLQRVIDTCVPFAQSAPKERVDVLRVTTDCPFISWELVDLAFELFEHYPRYDTVRLWGLAEKVPVYGAAEFPIALQCLERMNQTLILSDSPRVRLAREHVTADIDAERFAYQVIYPVPPRLYTETFYRPYRLELDTPEDLELVNTIIAELGLNPPLHQVIRFLDANPKVAELNAGISEKTGLAMYSLEQRARWKSQQSMHTVEWRGDWNWLKVQDMPKLPNGAKPIFCRKGIDYLGYTEKQGANHVLVTAQGVLVGRAQLHCVCGAGREWYEG